MLGLSVRVEVKVDPIGGIRQVKAVAEHVNDNRGEIPAAALIVHEAAAVSAVDVSDGVANSIAAPLANIVDPRKIIARVTTAQSGHTRYQAYVENNLGFLFGTIRKFSEAHEHLDRAQA